MMNLRETFSRIFEAGPKPTSKTSSSRNPYDENPDFRRFFEYHDQTPQISLPVSSYAELITGTEIQINADNDKAKEVIEEWIRSTNFYDKFEGSVTTMLICGNSLLEKLSDTEIQDVEEVDMRTITEKKRNKDTGETELYIQQTDDGGQNELVPKKFIEFNLRQYSRMLWSRSLFHSIAVPRRVAGRTIPPLVEQLWLMEDAMGAYYNNVGYAIPTITYEGADDKFLEKEKEEWKKYKVGERKLFNKKPVFEYAAPLNALRNNDIVEHIEKAIELGVQFPNDIMTGDFASRASSDTSQNIVLLKVKGFQRYLTTKLKNELFDIILTQKGFDPQEANLLVSFTTSNVITINVDQVNNLSDITPMEKREWLKTNTGMDLFEDDVLKARQQQRDVMVQQFDNPDDQQKFLKSKQETLKNLGL